MIGANAFRECTSLRRVICNNPDLFTYRNTPTPTLGQIRFISIGGYLNTICQDLLRTIDPSSSSNYSAFNTNYFSSKALNLIDKLHQTNYLPDWKTIATVFKNCSIDQIRDILNFFKKQSYVCNMMRIYSNPNMTLNGISIFLNPKDHANLSMTARDISLYTKSESEQLLDSVCFCSLQ